MVKGYGKGFLVLWIGQFCFTSSVLAITITRGRHDIMGMGGI